MRLSPTSSFLLSFIALGACAELDPVDTAPTTASEEGCEQDDTCASETPMCSGDECEPIGPRCGDARLDSGEECD